jgi:DNA-binding winged helix-turn-helix (wHTH) protein
VVDQAAALAERAIGFGPFRLLPTQRLLLEADKPVRLGSRALDILIALVERPGELVSKAELMARLWPSAFVEEGTLKVHVAALRRALGDGHSGRRFIATSPGQGYHFVAPVTRAEEPERTAPTAASTGHERNLPVLLTRLIGRSDTIARLAEQLPRQRLLTVVGPGGIGKTSVALAVADTQIAAYEHGVWLVDLAPLADPRFVPTALAAAIGFEIRSENSLPGLIAFLKDKRMLLVLDNCAHVVDAAAGLAVAILKGAAGVHILATSREPLRAQGEQVYRLPPLSSAPASPRLSAAEALAYPAVELFVERAGSLGEFELRDADAPIIAEICRQLDGIPLAIEFAAARVGALASGVSQHAWIIACGC